MCTISIVNDVHTSIAYIYIYGNLHLLIIMELFVMYTLRIRNGFGFVDNQLQLFQESLSLMEMLLPWRLVDQSALPALETAFLMMPLYPGFRSWTVKRN